jgi:hypothetical protein
MKNDEFTQIGKELIEDSKKLERSPGEIVQELFPYIYEASRRMSAREICRWLQEKRGIQISQPTISRALRNPSGFWNGFAETIEPVARRVASSLGVTLKHLLLDDGNESNYHFDLNYQSAKETLSASELKDVDEGMKFLQEKWFSLSAGTRRACAPSFIENESEEEQE